MAPALNVRNPSSPQHGQQQQQHGGYQPTGGSNSNSSNAYSTYASQMNFHPDKVFHKASDFANTGATAIKQILDRYPPLKAFALSFTATSALPVGVFAAITGSAFLGGIAVAGTLFALFQGFVLAAAGFVLFWFLLGALVFSGVVGGSVAVVYFGLHIAKTVVDRTDAKAGLR
ncbi:hypothetical protein HK100_004010 [Physocladia obscura]|uniref:Uncharacterized protein n=1 Tax=Physocladia obscura TaxID=109957 RepID=A0AAD5XL20_9FUNG|nr:hypothetical protein HK100_004010 [Physocladia obscura]